MQFPSGPSGGTCRQPPPADLFIYYLNGVLREERSRLGPHFIGNWVEDGDSFLFFSRPEDVLVEALIADTDALKLQDRFQMTYEQWQGSHIEPYAVGRLHVQPPWQKQAVPDDDTRIVLNPGVVFGTGTHPTTHDCLAALQLAMNHLPVDTVLDLGTGTGLLALAAARLGAHRVLALDLNFLAAETALANVRLNRLSESVLVIQGNAKNFMDLACDLMVSNIHYEVMRQMLQAWDFGVCRQFILSGLLRSQAREIEALLLKRSARILRKWDQDGVWHTFWGQTRENG